MSSVEPSPKKLKLEAEKPSTSEAVCEAIDKKINDEISDANDDEIPLENSTYLVTRKQQYFLEEDNENFSGNFQNLIINASYEKLPRFYDEISEKFMKKIEKSKKFIKKVEIIGIRTSEIVKVLRNLENLKELKLVNVFEFRDIEIDLEKLEIFSIFNSSEFLKNLKAKNVKFLEFSEHKISCLKFFKDFLKSCEKLEELSILWTNLKPNPNFNLEPQNFKLKKLSLINSEISGENFVEFLESQKSLEAVKVLHDLEDQMEMKNLLNFIFNSKRITSLEISTNVLVKHDFESKFGIKNLTLEICEFTGIKSREKINKLFKCCKSVENLTIFGAKNLSKIFEKVTSDFPCLNSLKIENLSQILIPRYLKHLEILSVRSENEFKNLLSLIKVYRRLETLKIKNFKFGESEIVEILLAIQSDEGLNEENEVRNLEEVYLGVECEISELLKEIWQEIVSKGKLKVMEFKNLRLSSENLGNL